MSCMDETSSPWPGILYRINNTSNDQLTVNSNGSKKIDVFRFMIVMRLLKIIYLIKMS